MDMPPSILLNYKGNSILGAGYFYAPYVPLMTTEVSRCTTLYLRRYWPGQSLRYYEIIDVRSIKSVHFSWWWPFSARRWHFQWHWRLELGDDRALPDPATECAICLGRDPDLTLRRAPPELWLWRDKYWVDAG